MSPRSRMTNTPDEPKVSNAPKTHGSLPVRMFMRPMTKILNPLVRAAAGRRHFGMAAQIHHRGRRSGRMYVTPASARLDGDTFWIPLTFGTESDWCRNVRAAGGCRIKWRGVEYTATDPDLVTVDVGKREARSAFNGYERLMFRMIGIKHFLRLRITEEDAAQVATLEPTDRRQSA